MKPRVLFVSRERHRLPLPEVQRRKWDAISDRLEIRVVAAAPEPQPAADPRFRLVAPHRPRSLDGALFYAELPLLVARELRSFRPEAVLVQGVHEAAAVFTARRLARVHPRVVLDVHGDWHEATRLYGSRLRGLLNPVSDALAPRMVRAADAVRTVSTPTTDLVRDAGVEPAATFAAYVDADVFLARAPAPLPETPRGVFVGVLERYKAFDTLMAAWPLARARLPQAELHVVGSGPLQSLLDGAQVEWSPRLSQEDVAAAMDDSWVLLLPSRSEGLPRVVIEAFCRGRAIIGGDRAGIPDLVRPEVNGLLVDPDDAADLADAIVRVLSDRALAEELGAQARRDGERWAVTPEEYAQQLETLIRGVLGS